MTDTRMKAVTVILNFKLFSIVYYNITFTGGRGQSSGGRSGQASTFKSADAHRTNLLTRIYIVINTDPSFLPPAPDNCTLIHSIS